MNKNDFPLLTNNPDLIYLDTAATSQKPRIVLDAINDYYEGTHSNVHRSGHSLSREATKRYEESRARVATFLGTKPSNIIFTRGTTESINLLANTYPLTQKDTIIVTELEHHSNLVPWQEAAKRAGATIKYVPIKNYELDLEAAKKLIEEDVTILAVAHVSNVLGSIQPIQELASLVHAQGGHIIVDGAQAAPHININVEELGVDAYAFSGHKTYGPTGIGALYIQDSLAEQLKPYQFGGNMIEEVTLEGSTYTKPPQMFEAGTPAIAPAIGLGVALKWLVSQPFGKEQEIYLYAKQQLNKLEGLTLYAPKKSTATLAFTIQGIDSHDIAEFLDVEHIAVRSGHHCTMPLHKTLGVKSTVRASIGLYTTKEDIDTFIEVLKKIMERMK